VTYRPLEIYQSALFVVVVVVGLCFVTADDDYYDYDGGGGGSGNLVSQPLLRSGLLNRCLRIYGMLTLQSRMPSFW